MPRNMKLVTFPVKDIAQATKVFAAVLGTEPYAEAPYYVGFRTGDIEVGLDPNGHAHGMTGPVPYWEVDDIKGSVADLIDAGAQLHQDVRDVGGGKLVATVCDADGNTIGLMQSP